MNSPALHPPSPPRRHRVRRGNSEDHGLVRQQALEAAFRLNRSARGLEGLTMRSLAAELGLSTMGLYRYFDSKAAVLQAMWDVVLVQALSHTTKAERPGASARENLSHCTEAFLRYWEAHPDQFSLVFMTPDTLNPASPAELTHQQAYQDAVQHGITLVDNFIRELGGDLKRSQEARALRYAIMVGYLHARLANRRYAWGDFDTLRRHTVAAVLAGIEACVRVPTPAD